LRRCVFQAFGLTHWEDISRVWALRLAAAERWPSIRVCWREGVFVLLGDGLTQTDVEQHILNWRPKPYVNWWRVYQKADTDAKTDRNVWLARNGATDEECRLLDSHIVSAAGRNRFNPLFGEGGRKGRRDYARVHSRALDLIVKAQPSLRLEWLRVTLLGPRDVALPELKGAGTWFIYANRTYNSGSDWYREGQISPWSFVLAMEGARLLSGTSSKRLSATRNYAAFPFISPSVPAEFREDGGGGNEFWAPLWEAPATVPALKSLLARGQARLGARSAAAPFEFALAARSCGTDAGVGTFVRFSLRQTTSRKTREAVPEEQVKTCEDGAVEALAHLSGWISRLPRDGAKDKQFFGIRGPIERALIRVASQPDEGLRWQELLLLLAESQARIDRNLNLRKTCAAIPPLSPKLFGRAWEDPPPELLVARAIAAIRGMPVRENIFGIRAGRFPEQRPSRAVWNEATPLASMVAVLERRLIDAGEQTAPLDSDVYCPPDLVYAFLDGALDDGLIGRWIRPFSLLDWTVGATQPKKRCPTVPGGAGVLYDLFKPLFQQHRICAPASRRLLRLIQQEWLDEAIAFARGRYLGAGIQTLDVGAGLAAGGQRMAAALLIPVAAADVERNFRKWILQERSEK
jgi:CRISPR-associated protein Csx17